MLLVDTDPQSLADVTGIDGPGLTLEETLNIPLRRPQHYRDRWDQLLSWLSRRWLYNIPKSMRTEGLRPLGRLAFVDHARQTCQRIRRGMMQAIEPESITASTAITGQEFRGDALRVYIVASVSGGTGSGAVMDVAFAVRTMLKKIAIRHATVTGILMHSTGRDPRHCELARVNAYSWLTEYQPLSSTRRRRIQAMRRAVCRHTIRMSTGSIKRISCTWATDLKRANLTRQRCRSPST